MNIENILDILKEKIEKVNPLPSKYSVSKGNQNGFEILVSDIIKEIIEEYENISYRIHLGHHFPDIDIIIDNYIYGVELKSRNNGSWITNGNSVFETISNSEYEEIFVFFGTQIGGGFNVKYKPYWQATEDIAVTHSPRFKVNMNASNSVFETKEAYDNFRNQTEESKSVFLQQYLSEKSQGVKWFAAKSESKIEPLLFKNLPFETRKRIIAEIFVLFPMDLLHPIKKNDYTNAAKYLISTYYTYSPSMRDQFTSGGQVSFDGLTQGVPQKYETFLKHKKEIKLFCDSASEDQKEFIYKKWENLDIELEKKNIFDDYLLILDFIGMYKSSEIKIDGTEMMLSELITTYEV